MMQRSVVASGCVVATLIVAPSAAAGGWWASIRLDRTRVAVGQEMNAHANVMFRSVAEAEAVQNREPPGAAFYVYLLRRFDYSLVQRAMGKPSRPNWWSKGSADAIRVGRVTIDVQESNLALARASFPVPDVPPGRYAIMLCDEGCTQPLADVIPTHPKQLTVTAPRAAGTPWVQRFGWLVIGLVLGALLGFVFGRLGGPTSPEPDTVSWQPSDEAELEELLSARR